MPLHFGLSRTSELYLRNRTLNGRQSKPDLQLRQGHIIISRHLPAGVHKGEKMSTTISEAVADALPGACDHGEGMVTFALYAPNKKSVHLIGDFNDWESGRDAFEQRDEGYWVIAKNMSPGRHEYQFVIDDSLVICDPYAQDIEMLADPYEQPHAVLEVGRPIYKWQHLAWQRPNLRDLIIYELQVGDFSPGGTFQGVIDRLDYLRDLGINALECMPLYVSTRPHAYWGYEPNYFLAVRRSFGSMLDLMRLIDEAHARGMAIILDLVLNHTGQEHPFMKMYSWEESPWYGDPIGERNQFGLPTLDFTKPATNAFVRDVQAYWLRVFHIDGFRYDYLAGLGSNEEGQGLPYLMRTAREIRPEAFLIGECIPENPELTNGSGLSAIWHTRSRIALECLIRERDEEPYKVEQFEEVVATFDPATQGYDDASFMVNYMECHDDVRFVGTLRELGFSDELAHRKSALAATVLMTIPGEPMLYQGQEWGEDTQRAQKENKIHWERRDTQIGQWLYEHYANLCRLRRERTSLRAHNFEFSMIAPDRRIIVFHRWLGDADHVVVAANFSPDAYEVNIPFPHGGHWRERFSDQLFKIAEEMEYKIDAYGAVVFTSGVS